VRLTHAGRREEMDMEWTNEQLVASGKRLIERFGSYETNNSIELQAEVTALREALEKAARHIYLDEAGAELFQRIDALLTQIPK
jgi:hypothetical protein